MLNAHAAIFVHHSYSALHSFAGGFFFSCRTLLAGVSAVIFSLEEEVLLMCQTHFRSQIDLLEMCCLSFSLIGAFVFQFMV